MVLANHASCLDVVPTRCASRPFDFAQGELRVRVGVGGAFIVVRLLGLWGKVLVDEGSVLWLS